MNCLPCMVRRYKGIHSKSGEVATKAQTAAKNHWVGATTAKNTTSKPQNAASAISNLRKALVFMNPSPIPKCGMASHTKWETNAAGMATNGLWIVKPISAPAKAWLVAITVILVPVVFNKAYHAFYAMLFFFAGMEVLEAILPIL